MMRPTLSDLLRQVHVAGYDERHIASRIMNLGGGRAPFVFTTVAISNLVNAAETVAGTTPPLNPPSDFANILIIGFMTLTIGASGNLATLRIRQGATVAGADISQRSITTVVAAASEALCVFGVDTPGAVGGIQYSMTGQIGAGAANTTVNFLLLAALALG